LATTITFLNNVAYDAASAALLGNQGSTGTAQAFIIQPSTADSYDGTIALQFSPDGGATWFSLPMYDSVAIGTAVYTVAAPVSTKAYIAPVPSYVLVRVTMTGGSTGHLTVTGLATAYLAP